MWIHNDVKPQEKTKGHLILEIEVKHLIPNVDKRPNIVEKDVSKRLPKKALHTERKSS